MTNAIAEIQQQANAASINPVEWLLLWCTEHGETDPGQICRASGLSSRELADLQAAHPAVMDEIRGLHRLGRLFSLDMLFELLRQRLAQMLAQATKPMELRSLLGSLRQLPGAKELLSAAGSATAPRSDPPAGETGSAEPDVNECGPTDPDQTQLPGQDSPGRAELVSSFEAKARGLLEDKSLPRQQRRQLERQLKKLQSSSN